MDGRKPASTQNWFNQFSDNKEKKKHKTDPKNHPEDIPVLVIKVTHFWQEPVGSDMSYTCLRLPWDFYKSLDAGHIEEVNELTLA